MPPALLVLYHARHVCTPPVFTFVLCVGEEEERERDQGDTNVLNRLDPQGNHFFFWKVNYFMLFYGNKSPDVIHSDLTNLVPSFVRLL